MNSLRERLSPAERAGRGGARVGGSYVQGAVFNPKTLIQLLNIFRVHYNFFELRPYACPLSDLDELINPSPKSKPRALRIPGTNEFIELPAKARRTPELRTPAMRHGIDGLRRRKDGAETVPDIYRILYRPWLLAGTKFGARLDRSRRSRKATEAAAKEANQSESAPENMPSKTLPSLVGTDAKEKSTAP